MGQLISTIARFYAALHLVSNLHLYEERTRRRVYIAPTDQKSDLPEDSMTKKTKIDRILNVFDLQDPQPSIIIIETLKKMKKGESVEIIGSRSIMQSMEKTLLKKKEYSLLESSQKQGHTHCIVKINEAPTPS
jgi:TusA-related sulfurtransferase